MRMLPLRVSAASFFFFTVSFFGLAAPAPKLPPPKERATLKGHKKSVVTIAFSPDSKLLASGSFDNTVILWDAIKGEKLATFTEHNGHIGAVAFSPDRRVLASSGWDRKIRLWDVTKNEGIACLSNGFGVWDSLVFSPDSKTVASSGCLWDIPTKKLREKLKPLSRGNDKGRIETPIVYDANGRLLCAVLNLGREKSCDLEVWDLLASKSIQGLKFPEGHRNFRIAFSADRKLLASGGEGIYGLCIWDITSGKLRGKFKRPEGLITCLAFSPDSKLIATAWRRPLRQGGSDGVVVILEAATGKELARLEKHSYPIECIAFSPDGRTLATGGSGDAEIKLWDVRGVRQLKKD